MPGTCPWPTGACLSRPTLIESKMKLLQIPQGSSYNPELAKELLLLVQQAHQEFDRSQSDPSWDWDTDKSGIIINGKEYKIRMRFGFAEYSFLPSNVSATDPQELGGMGRDRVPFGFLITQLAPQGTFWGFKVVHEYQPGHDPQCDPVPERSFPA